MNGEVDLTFFHDVMEMDPGRTGNKTEITEPEIRLFDRSIYDSETNE